MTKIKVIEVEEVSSSFVIEVADASGKTVIEIVESPTIPVIEIEVPGVQGVPGLSAYDVAKEGGFTGSKAEWLESLKGKLEVFTHEQMMPSALWTINHGMTNQPVVSVTDGGASEIVGDVAHPSVGITTITFAFPIIGRARLI